MKYKSYFVISILTAAILLAPNGVRAQVPGIQADVSGIQDLIKADQLRLGALQKVPVSAPLLEAKDNPIRVLGVSIGISWNTLALRLGRIVIDQFVNATVRWINTGFDDGFNKGPAYVTDPGAFFGQIANGVAGDFISNSRVGFLCSPLQSDLLNFKLSLATYYTQDYQPQCTLTGIKGNIEDFYSNFSNGGWGTFIQMTQVSGNNPYGALVDAQIELDRRVAAAVAVQKIQLDWGQGFKSQAKCLLYNGNPSNNTVNIGGITTSAPSTYNPNFEPGACIDYGPITTPGSTIKAHLDEALPANNFIKQIVQADDFNKIISALISGSLKRFVFGDSGLLGKGSKDSGTNTSGIGTGGPAPTVTCSASPTTGIVNQTKVIWSAQANADAVEFIWSGEGLTNATGTNVTVTYTSSGTKVASVIASTSDVITDINPETGEITRTYTNHQPPITVSCSNSVQISKYQPLQVQCSPYNGIVKVDMPAGSSAITPSVTWQAIISGGSGILDKIEWGGSQDRPPKTNGDGNRIFPRGIDFSEPAIQWIYLNLACGNGCPKASSNNWTNVAPSDQPLMAFAVNGTGVTFQQLLKRADGTLTSWLSRVYYRDADPLGNVDATVLVVDKDPTVAAIQAQCGNIFINDGTK
ncbi:hypothetical protein KW785_02800 [Candidatus Parcubacteria bacterium]|nr:hypothetical protein [Candidatus Parcubacteria bacterium]